MKKVLSLYASLRGCNKDILNDAAMLQTLLSETASHVNATPYGSVESVYVPHGVTSVIFLAESHIMISTWPEFELALIDMNFCGDIEPYNALTFMEKKLSSKFREDVHLIERRLEQINQ